MKKPITELDINKIDKKHLITMNKGEIIYRRTSCETPLRLVCSRGTFTTITPLEKLGYRTVHRPTASASAAFTTETMFKETQNYVGECKVYEIVMITRLSHILDLDQVCKDQGIEDIYLKPDGNYKNDDEELMAEYPLHQLYDKEIEGKRLNGVKYRSRQHSEGYCLVFYDNILFRSPIKNRIIKEIKNFLSQFLRLNLSQRHRHSLSKLILSLSDNVLYDYMCYEDITDRIVKFGDKQGEKHWSSPINWI